MKPEHVTAFLEHGLLVSPEMLTEQVDFSQLHLPRVQEGPAVLNKAFLHLFLNNGHHEWNWIEFESAIAFKEKGRNTKAYETFLHLVQPEIPVAAPTVTIQHTPIPPEPALEIAVPEVQPKKAETQQKEIPSVCILKTFTEDVKKREVSDFINHFRGRYTSLRALLMHRSELRDGLTSINKLKAKEDREEVALIGIVFEKRTTKNGHIELQIEDITGRVKVMITKDRKEAYQRAKDVSLDEVIGIRGAYGKNVVFANRLLYPDVPADNPLKKGMEEVYALFISDVHVGSKKFLEKEFLQFIGWLNGKVKDAKYPVPAEKVRYLFVVGDLIDGIGVYPGQEKELVLGDVVQQYQRAAELFQMVRKDVTIIICPGQHDALRNSEPQPQLSKAYAAALHDIPNILLVGNPSYITIGKTKEFGGINVLMYHGASFHYFIDNIDSLRLGKARDNPRLLMKFLLQKRHLAPSHAATVYVPSLANDPMVIGQVPDIFACGDMHRSDVASYNNVTTINGSCWQAKTDFQEKTGNNPDFCKVPCVNLKTREVTVLEFYNGN
ncbi:MAG TPA: metallophosphoesterase [Candidatus Nanoarchaeia archaeon]|nr:metallophosphoesterase [Candidatus Nanoarchaeia archaeon]